jgi:Na+/H+ antiporter
MEPTHLFELVIAMFIAIIALNFVANKLGLPPSVALLVGGGVLAFAPGLPAIAVNPELVLVIFLPPLLMDGAWAIALGPLRRHMVGVAALAVGAVFFTCAVVAVVTHFLFPALPWAACAALGAIIAPPDAVSARAVLERVKLPARMRILLEGESLFNDASGLVLFRFAIAAGVTGMFSAADAAGGFALLAVGGVAVGAAAGFAWVKLTPKLGDDYLIVASTILLCWASYLLAEILHVSGVMATVTAGVIASWNMYAVMSASTRMRGGSFWAVLVFLMEAAVFILIGLSLRGVLDRAGGLAVAVQTMWQPILIILLALTITRFVWVFGSDSLNGLFKALKLTDHRPLGARASTVLSWAAVRGVVTLALALSVPEGFPGRDFILVTAFAVIVWTVLVQGMTLGRVIRWARLVETDKPRLNLSQAEAAMANVQLAALQDIAYQEGELVHPQLLETFQKRARAIGNLAERTEELRPQLHAHFDAILEVVAVGRRELLRLHRAGEIDDDTLHDLEHDLDLEELIAISNKT